jgi:transposase
VTSLKPFPGLWILKHSVLIWIQALAYSDGSKGGRPPFDPVLMFKILLIQTLNNLSDERTEYLINDRLSFMRFLRSGAV